MQPCLSIWSFLALAGRGCGLSLWPFLASARRGNFLAIWGASGARGAGLRSLAFVCFLAWPFLGRGLLSLAVSGSQAGLLSSAVSGPQAGFAKFGRLWPLRLAFLRLAVSGPLSCFAQFGRFSAGWLSSGWPFLAPNAGFPQFGHPLGWLSSVWPFLAP